MKAWKAFVLALLLVFLVAVTGAALSFIAVFVPQTGPHVLRRLWPTQRVISRFPMPRAMRQIL
jgi:hypothetical protein